MTENHLISDKSLKLVSFGLKDKYNFSAQFHNELFQQNCSALTVTT